jgi:hypothetical protein
MTVASKDLWTLALDQHWIDPEELAQAVVEQIAQEDLDYRSRVLIRDSVKALRHRWGPGRLEAWLSNSGIGDRIASICEGPWEDDRGFPSLMSRLMEPTRPEKIKQFLRELSVHIRKPTRIEVGGSVALMLPLLLSRRTEDVDIVDEVPADIRSQHKVIADLKARYDLVPAHFQQHYLPSDWKNRLHYFDTYGEMRIYLVDPYDVLLSKLFSIRTKDLDDLRAVMPQINKETFAERLKDKTQSMLAATDLRKRAEQNWFILFGEALPA